MLNININKLLETKKLGTILKLLFAYIAVCGLVLFPCFIAEEAIQVAIWGTWPAKTSQNWNLVLKGCDLINSINLSLKIINYSVGWIQPLAFLSYRSFAQGTDYYVESVKNEILRKSPKCFHNKKVELLFTPERILQEDGLIKLISYNLIVITDHVPEKFPIKIKGTGEAKGKVLIIRMEK